jgi:hypothetical protein
VAAGRKGVFSRVAEARAAAAQANRLRISRAHGARASSPGGSSASAVSPAAKRKPTFVKVGKILVTRLRFLLWIGIHVGQNKRMTPVFLKKNSVLWFLKIV